MDRETKLVSVGEVVNTQGHRGEVRVWPLTDFPERFKQGEVFIYEKNGAARNLTIEMVRSQKNFFVIKFREIPDMNAAEEIKGGVLKISRDRLVELPADTYFIFEIIGMKVLTIDGLELGKVKDVVQTGSNDVYVIEGENKDYLIPALKDVIKRVDKDQKQIIIKPMDGLLDL